MDPKHLQKLSDKELAQLARGLYADVMVCFNALACRGCTIYLGTYKIVDYTHQEVKIVREETL